MDHFEALSLADGHSQGRLAPAEAAALQAHLAACPDCRAILAAWPATAATPDLWPGLRERVAPRAALRAPAWVLPLATALSLALVLSAFWRPERAWLRSGETWAYSGLSVEGRP